MERIRQVQKEIRDGIACSSDGQSTDSSGGAELDVETLPSCGESITEFENDKNCYVMCVSEDGEVDNRWACNDKPK